VSASGGVTGGRSAVKTRASALAGLRTADTARAVAALVAAAHAARARAVAPFSGFTVGAALETENGSIVTGCNIENASYGLTMCAERVAVFKAVSEGHRAFRRIAVVVDAREPAAPCGACRQILWEYGGDLEVILANLVGLTARSRMSQLLPLPFDSGVLASAPPRTGDPRRNRSHSKRRRQRRRA
jgi:cytidine deaminase